VLVFIVKTTLRKRARKAWRTDKKLMPFHEYENINPSKDEAQTALFKEPVRTAL
jgi:hypothetical protein